MRYEERLEVFELQKLKLCRKKRGLIKFFKIENNIEKINFQKTITKKRATGQASGLRGHSARYCLEKTRSDKRSHFFKNRVLSTWNYKLDEDPVKAFKNGVYFKLYKKNKTFVTVSGLLSKCFGL